VPVLVPGSSMPRPSTLSKPLQPLLEFTFYEVRKDPTYAMDMERLVAFLRGQINPMIRMGILPLPTQLPLHAEQPIRSLVRACNTLRWIALRIAQGKLSMQDLSKREFASLSSANVTMNQWGKYFSLIPTDRWLDARGITYIDDATKKAALEKLHGNAAPASNGLIDSAARRRNARVTV